MKTKILLIVMLFVLTVSVNAQTQAADKADTKLFKIGVGAMIGLPIGDISDYANLTYGADLMGEYTVAPSFGLTLSAGYLGFGEKSGYTIDGFIPVLVGGKYYFADKFYGSVQAGVSISTEDGGGNWFTFAPGVGYKVSEKFDLSLKYQSATKNSADFSFLGLRAGYTF